MSGVGRTAAGLAMVGRAVSSGRRAGTKTELTTDFPDNTDGKRMNRGSIWTISVRTAPEAEEAVTEWLEQVFKHAPVSYTDTRTRVTRVSVYLPKKPLWTVVERERLRAGLGACLKNGGRRGKEADGCMRLPGNPPRYLGGCKISLAKIPSERWANSWKRHFQPIEIGSALLIRPSWSRRAPRKGAAVVQIDPGLSFGTGQHPTTAFCLRQLVARRRSGKAQSCLDAGTGSGILAIAAAQLGYAPIDALDSDPDAIRIARANARQNGVGRRIRFVQQEISRLPRWSGTRYAVVCANLIADLLLTQRDRLLARLQPDGVLVIAGVLDREFGQVQTAYEAAGWMMLTSRREREWRSGSFARGVNAA